MKQRHLTLGYGRWLIFFQSLDHKILYCRLIPLRVTTVKAPSPDFCIVTNSPSSSSLTCSHLSLLSVCKWMTSPVPSFVRLTESPVFRARLQQCQEIKRYSEDNWIRAIIKGSRGRVDNWDVMTWVQWHKWLAMWTEMGTVTSGRIFWRSVHIWRSASLGGFHEWPLWEAPIRQRTHVPYPLRVKLLTGYKLFFT